MTVHPLPLRVRLHHGETLDSYAQRLARANHSTIHDIEQVLRSRGLLPRTGQHDPARLAAWRALGDLGERAFTTPTRTQLDEPVQTRQLCRRCTHGDNANGRLPRTGHICLNHRIWFSSDPQHCVAHFPAAIAAERAFRRLTKTGLTIDSELVRVAEDCASRGVPDELIHARAQAHQVPPESGQCLTYPETVRFAQLMVTPAFTTVAYNPGADTNKIRALLRRETHRLLPGSATFERRRAQAALALWCERQRQQARNTRPQTVL